MKRANSKRNGREPIYDKDGHYIGEIDTHHWHGHGHEPRRPWRWLVVGVLVALAAVYLWSTPLGARLVEAGQKLFSAQASTEH